MANLKKYEIDAIVDEVQNRLIASQPEFDPKLIEDTPEFKILQKKHEDIEKLQDELKELRKIYEDVFRNVYKHFVGTELQGYFHIKDPQSIVDTCRHKHQTGMSKADIQTQVVLSNHSDLSKIVEEVFNKLKNQ